VIGAEGSSTRDGRGSVCVCVTLRAYIRPSDLLSARSTRPNAPLPSSRRNLKDDSLEKGERTTSAAAAAPRAAAAAAAFVVASWVEGVQGAGWT